MERLFLLLILFSFMLSGCSTESSSHNQFREDAIQVFNGIVDKSNGLSGSSKYTPEFLQQKYSQEKLTEDEILLMGELNNLWFILMEYKIDQSEEVMNKFNDAKKKIEDKYGL